MMKNFQLSFFYNLQVMIEVSSFYRKYYLIFQCLPLEQFPDKNYGVGRTGYSRHAMLKAFIIKHLEHIESVPRLIEYLDSRPPLTHMCGFNPGSLPDESQFYRFIKGIPNSVFEKIHTEVNRKLIKEGVISMNTFVIDSKPVMAATRENNLKNPNRNTRNKEKTPKRNPAAALGYYSYQEVNGKKDNYLFFWGYRTHVIVSKEGVPLIEKTLPNNRTDAKVAMQLIKKLKRIFKFKDGAFFIADAAYDERDIYNLIVNNMKGKPFIPINPRNQQPEKTFGSHGCPLCSAKLEMKSWGIFTEGLRTRLKFRCPVKTNRKVAARYPKGCPVHHPRFTDGKGYGCTKYLDITDDARSRAPRDTEFYKETYKLRMVVEQYFSRLGDREVEQTTHYKLRTVQNQMTIAHLSMSLIASAAAILLKRPDKIRCYRTFAQGPLLRQTA
ncbi:MAG: transposase [Candidatus Brocadiales bacterium]